MPPGLCAPDMDQVDTAVNLSMGRFESGHERYTDVRLARINVVADETASRYANGTMQGRSWGPGLRLCRCVVDGRAQGGNQARANGAAPTIGPAIYLTSRHQHVHDINKSLSRYVLLFLSIRKISLKMIILESSSSIPNFCGDCQHCIRANLRPA